MRVAFVTGAGSGIGRATALRLARAGAAVAGFDRDEAALTAVVEEIRACGVEATSHVGDVTSPADVERAVSGTAETLGAIDAVAACAGIEVPGTVADMGLDDWDRAIAVNLTGVMLTARATVPAMAEAGAGGAFVAISSDAGVQGTEAWTPYCVSKHGVIGLVRCLALDYGPAGVRSNVVCPSMVQTPMSERIFADAGPGEREAWSQLLPLGRFAQPPEIADVVCHLLSDESSYTNGLVYLVDGGQTAGPFFGRS